MSADGRYGIGMRCLVLTPSPSPASLERGDQSHARGRSNAVYATLARMFCPPLNPGGKVWEGAGAALRRYVVHPGSVRRSHTGN